MIKSQWCCRISASLTVLTLGCSGAPARDQVIALDLTGAHPTAQLFIGARSPVTVIFDSGAGANIVGTALATSLGLPNNGDIAVGSPGATAPLLGFKTEIASARLGDAVLGNTQAVAIDLPLLQPGIAGVISPNSFAGRLVRFEFARGRAIVMDRTNDKIPEGQGDAYGGEFGHPLPSARIDVAGTSVVAHLDSGSHFALLLPLEFSKRVPLRGNLVPIPPIKMTGGTHAAFSATIAGTVHIGPLSLTDPEVIFEEGAPIANVGIRILREMTLVLDPKSQRSWMLQAG